MDLREKQVKTHSIKLGRLTGKEQDFYQESQVIALDEHDNVAITSDPYQSLYDDLAKTSEVLSLALAVKLASLLCFYAR